MLAILPRQFLSFKYNYDQKYLVYPLVCEKTRRTDADEATIERAREHLR
jgi:hypothetical protein